MKEKRSLSKGPGIAEDKWKKCLKKKKKTGPTTKRGTFGDVAYILYVAEYISLCESVKFN